MRRTQIYLTDEQASLLDARSEATGSTISQLIRDAIDTVYASRRVLTRAEKLRLAADSAGSWSRLRETGAGYVERLRGSGRLTGLHDRQR